MESTLELQVARAVGQAHLMEAVLHGFGRWEMSLGSWGVSDSDLVVPAHRVVEGTLASIEAEFPSHCWLDPRPTVLMLLLDGEIAGVREINHPGDGAFTATWSFSLEVVEQAA